MDFEKLLKGTMHGLIAMWLLIVLIDVNSIRKELNRVNDILCRWEQEYEEFRENYEFAVHEECVRNTMEKA